MTLNNRSLSQSFNQNKRGPTPAPNITMVTCFFIRNLNQQPCFSLIFPIGFFRHRTLRMQLAFHHPAKLNTDLSIHRYDHWEHRATLLQSIKRRIEHGYYLPLSLVRTTSKNWIIGFQFKLLQDLPSSP